MRYVVPAMVDGCGHVTRVVDSLAPARTFETRAVPTPPPPVLTAPGGEADASDGQ